jgi:hypothetical protein
MTRKFLTILRWLPRVLAILYIIFISIFALDAFGEPQWFLALIMHLIPNFVLIILTIVAWRYQLFGGILFLATGLAMTYFFHTVGIVVPVFVIGTLFLVEVFWKKKKKFIS